MSRDPDRIEVAALAKVNLFLEVLGRRADGYHDLRSVVMPVSLSDRIVVERTGSAIETRMAAGSDVCREAMSCTTSDGNLATRAAVQLKKATGVTCGALISIEKRIPIGGGLGGGSADAAAVLDALNRLWNTNLPREQLMKLGAGIGCDIPALVHGGAVCMEGTGERVSPCFGGGPVPCDPWWLVLANPGFPVSTGDIYQRYTAGLTNGGAGYNNMLLALRKNDVAMAASGLFNSLQDTVFRKYPAIEMVVERLLQAGAMNAMVSGSGGSVFGVARDEAHARQIAAGVGSRMEEAVWVHVVNTLPGGVMVAHGPLEPFV